MSEAISGISPVWSRVTNIIADRGEGSIIFGKDGKEYLDFTCGIGVTNTGHCHPRVVEAVKKQAGKLLHGQVNIVFHQPLIDLVNELQKINPFGLDGVFLKNSGSEAVEAAIKLARTATGRPNIIAFQGSFHGRTVGTMSLTTSKTIYRAGYQPLMPGVTVAPFPYAYRYGWDEKKTVAWCLSELEYLLLSQTAPHETAAMIVEPVLGEGGYVVPPKGFHKGLREICDRYGILLIIDEVQSGFGRTGKWFALEHFDDVTPDIIIVAKGLASGLPLSGVISRMEIMERWVPGSEGGTYNANALACAAALATIQVIRDENLNNNTLVRGQQLMAGLQELQKNYPVIGDVRGLGLMIGVEFTDSKGDPDAKTAKAVQAVCLDENLLLLTCGTYGNTIRFIPPLIVTEEQIASSLVHFEKALKAVKG